MGKRYQMLVIGLAAGCFVFGGCVSHGQLDEAMEELREEREAEVEGIRKEYGEMQALRKRLDAMEDSSQVVYGGLYEHTGEMVESLEKLQTSLESIEGDNAEDEE